MAETLGSLCDKLTIVKLKQFHTQDTHSLDSLQSQERLLKKELDEYITNAVSGNIPIEELEFPANKVHNIKENRLRVIPSTFADAFSALAEINCALWHEQDKVYHFNEIPAEEKNRVIDALAVLNLDRNRAIDKLNSLLADKVRK